MVQVSIEYQVDDKEGRSFRPVNDIANDVEREIWNSPLFSEATYYHILVKNEEDCASIIYPKENSYEKIL